MKTRFLFLVFGFIAAVTATQAAIITVTTTSNAPVAGQTNLTQAIKALHDGDTINFNIPSPAAGQVFYLVTPSGGYPFITNNNVTINGYSQPGATPNTNPIHAPNNARIKICLDSRNGEATDMGNYTNFIDPTIIGGNLKPGFGHDEWGIIPIFRGTNVHIRGLAILSSPLGSDGVATIKSVSVACDYVGDASGWHVDGCWIGVDPADGQIKYLPDGVTAASPGIGFATYGHSQGSDTNVYANYGTFGVAKGSTNPPAEFNVLVTGYGLDLQGWGHRYAGNFANVLPDGMHNADWSKINGGAQEGDGDFECGGNGVGGLTIGTDGDGVNDAQEGNVFGGALDTGWTHVYLYSSPKTNIVIAGNWFGVAVDGTTRFTNSARVLHTLGSQGYARVGSDFDGVSDALEANVIYNNYPFADAYPTPVGSTPARLFDLDVGSRLSLRGNTMVGNTLVPYNYADGAGGRLDNFTNYESGFMSTNADVIPVLSPTNIFPRLTGTCAIGNGAYTNIIIDVYQLDPEGWADGQQFGLQELVAPDGSTNGFPEGRKYLGSFVDNGPFDRDPAIGKFDLDLSGLDLGPGRVTVTANYSADPPGTHNGRVHTSDFAMPVTLIPGGVGSVKLAHVVPDTLLWYNQNGNYYTNGPVDPGAQLANLGNWEPYTSVMGDSTFLIGANTFADDQTPPVASSQTGPFQRFVVTFQPAAGGAPKIGEEFFADNGTPYRGVINLSRENGNPERVAGDKRLGATNFLSAAETSAGQIPLFQSDSRWSSNLIYQGENRYVTVQPFSLDPATLTQTPLHNAFDAVYGEYVDHTTTPGGGTQISRTGGTVAALDNGNFVVVWDDKTTFSSTAGEVTTFGITTPTGSIIRTNTLVDPRDIWDNVAAYRGGFAVRVHNLLYFYDNNGNAQHTNDINVSSGLTFGTGREDGSRIGSDIRSVYVYLAGQTPETGKTDPVNVAIWDSRTGDFVASAQVSDGDLTTQTIGRAVVAVDALDRFCVAYELKPNANFGQTQVAARVLKFDGTNIASLTHSFFPFVNYDPDGSLGLITSTMNASMTTRQILIAAKGMVNSTNVPSGGPNTAKETTLYTVISHPDPQPTPGASEFKLTSINVSGTSVTLAWSGGASPFQIQGTASLSNAVWQTVATVTNQQTATVPATGSTAFYRVQGH